MNRGVSLGLTGNQTTFGGPTPLSWYPTAPGTESWQAYLGTDPNSLLLETRRTPPELF